MNKTSVWVIILLILIAFGTFGYVQMNATKQKLPMPKQNPSPTQAQPTANPSTSSEQDENQSAAVDIARQDLAKKLNVSASEITVKSVQKTQFGDTSLGCPQPGMMYSQVITDGYKVQLQHKETSYPYNVDQNGNFATCDK